METGGPGERALPHVFMVDMVMGVVNLTIW